MSKKSKRRYYDAKLMKALYKRGIKMRDVRTLATNPDLVSELNEAIKIILDTQEINRETITFKDIDIRDLELETSVRNGLLRNRITSIGVLALHTSDEIRQLHLFGAKRTAELETLLLKHGLTFRVFREESAGQKADRYAVVSPFVRDYFAIGIES